MPKMIFLEVIDNIVLVLIHLGMAKCSAPVVFNPPRFVFFFFSNGSGSDLGKRSFVPSRPEYIIFYL